MTAVYFIRPIGIEAGPVKIGVSVGPDQRRKTLETWCPYPLEVAAEIPGDYLIEARFHALFQEDHTHGEWFRWSYEIEAVIEAINDGTFDLSVLPEPLHIAKRTKDNSFSTPVWRFARSVAAKVRHLRARGFDPKLLSLFDLNAPFHPYMIERLSEDDLPALKERVERELTAIRASGLPRKARRA